jgi:A/G-specific adenine glycosylase
MPDPYHVLVSEAMLQQTQVATVIPYYLRFMERFPTIETLAAADEQEVLRYWQGLGYFSRARNLQKAARAVVSEHGGAVPGDLEALLTLPGVGRYTAGAIASLAYDRRAPILDGNVVRVLCRLDLIRSDPTRPATRSALWQRAEEVLPEHCAGDFISALMELGATVCTPKNPRCLFCPVQKHCAAVAEGVQEQVPAPRKGRTRPVERRHTFCIRSGEHWLIEQRQSTGRWASMWQFLTVPATAGRPTRAGASRAATIPVTTPRRIGAVSHTLTHRQYEFEIFLCRATHHQTPLPHSELRQWVSLSGLSHYPLSRPQLQIAQLLEAHQRD